MDSVQNNSDDNRETP